MTYSDDKQINVYCLSWTLYRLRRLYDLDGDQPSIDYFLVVVKLPPSSAILEAAYHGEAKFPCLCQSLGEARGVLLTVSQIQLCT